MSIQNMITCGIDVGSRATKAVILNNDLDVLGRGWALTKGKPAESSMIAFKEALLAARLQPEIVKKIAVTGFGRHLVPGENVNFTSLSCHAAGARRDFPDARNVIDVGALRSTVMRLDENGYVHRFRLNDQCGSGMGRYLERLASIIEIPLEEIGELALFSRNPEQVPEICAVLAETEVLSLITINKKPADILRGVYNALAARLVSMLKNVWVPGKLTVLTGGIAKNAGMIAAIEEALGFGLAVSHDAEFSGAIGAAILARET